MLYYWNQIQNYKRTSNLVDTKGLQVVVMMLINTKITVISEIKTFAILVKRFRKSVPVSNPSMRLTRCCCNCISILVIWRDGQYGYLKWQYGYLKWQYGYIKWQYGYLKWQYSYLKWQYGYLKWQYGYLKWWYGYLKWCDLSDDMVILVTIWLS